MTGRPARGIVNRLMREIGPINPIAPEFPLAAGALAPLRAKAEAAGSGDFSPMWSGQAAALGRVMPARELTRALAAEAQALLAAGDFSRGPAVWPPGRHISLGNASRCTADSRCLRAPAVAITLFDRPFPAPSRPDRTRFDVVLGQSGRACRSADCRDSDAASGGWPNRSSLRRRSRSRRSRASGPPATTTPSPIRCAATGFCASTR